MPIPYAPTSWNPITGCTAVSASCENCWAARQAATRLKHNSAYAGLARRTDGGRYQWTGEVRLHPEKLSEPLYWRKPRRIAVAFMGDLFHPDVPDQFILAIWAVMNAAPHLTFQLLTKRPQRMRAFLASFVNGNCHEPMSIQPAYERREIPGWPGYYADTEGTIWSERRGTIRALAPCVTSKWGHAHVVLHAGAGQSVQQIKIHRLILTTFDRPPAEGEETRHLDGDPTNNRIGNLRWGTCAENSEDRTRHGNAVTAPYLTVQDVAAIRIAAIRGDSQRSIGERFGVSHTQVGRTVSGESWGPRPLPNVWLGVTVENQEEADRRVPLLLETPAAHRWVSYEPALSAVDFSPWLSRPCACGANYGDHGDTHRHNSLDWTVLGSESGPNARPFDLDWARSVRDQCVAARVPFYLKQVPSVMGKLIHAPILDGRQWQQLP